MNSRIAKKVEKNAGKRPLPPRLLRAAGKYLTTGGQYDYRGRRVKVPKSRLNFSDMVGGEVVIDRHVTIILRDDGEVQRGGQYTMCDG